LDCNPKKKKKKKNSFSVKKMVRANHSINTRPFGQIPDAKVIIESNTELKRNMLFNKLFDLN